MKKLLRQEILRSRTDLPEEQVEEKSRDIVARLFNLPAWQSARMVMVYLDFRHEVRTGEVITRTMAEGKRMVVPVCERDPLRLVPSEVIRYPDDLTPGTWGIMEPKPGCLRPVNPLEIDLVLVPGVAFDVRGNRLGYGAGYYDRFLASLRPDAKTAALAYELQIRENVFPEAHDRPVRLVVTEQRVIDCVTE